MSGRDTKNPLRAAIAAVRSCADAMDEGAEHLTQAMATATVDDGLRASAVERCAGLKDVAGRVLFELALLQTEVSESNCDASDAVRRLSAMDAALLSAVASMTDVVDRLEVAAENDERHESAYVMVIEKVGVLLQSLDKARAATQALTEST